MDVITPNVILFCWLTFWISYICFGAIVSYIAHVKDIRKATKIAQVIEVIANNASLSLFALGLLNMFPIRWGTEFSDITKFFLSYVFASVYFYHVHYLFHHPDLYPLHKKHHEFQQPWGLAGLYCSPCEMVFVNTFTASLGPIILQMSPSYVYVWNFLLPINVILSHSGLTIPYFMDNSHDLHHKYFTCNYGINSVLDKFYGTYK